PTSDTSNRDNCIEYSGSYDITGIGSKTSANRTPDPPLATNTALATALGRVVDEIKAAINIAIHQKLFKDNVNHGSIWKYILYMSNIGERIKCRAAVAYGLHQPLVVEDIYVDPPKDNEIRIKLVASGICRSDLHIIDSNISKDFIFPLILGHEGSGVVE
ncbi:unnamed protein product, partial [Medioppia subpectinata]